jgi:hypothetical protein
MTSGTRSTRPAGAAPFASSAGVNRATVNGSGAHASSGVVSERNVHAPLTAVVNSETPGARTASVSRRNEAAPGGTANSPRPGSGTSPTTIPSRSNLVRADDTADVPEFPARSPNNGTETPTSSPRLARCGFGESASDGPNTGSCNRSR